MSATLFAAALLAGPAYTTTTWEVRPATKLYVVRHPTEDGVWAVAWSRGSASGFMGTGFDPDDALPFRWPWTAVAWIEKHRPPTSPASSRPAGGRAR